MSDLLQLTEQQVLDSMSQGKPVQGAKIEKLHLKNEVFPHEIHISNCEIGDVVFHNCVFRRAFYVKNTVFTGKVELNIDPEQFTDAGQTVFELEAKFRKCTFQGEFLGKGTHFNEFVSFKGSVFEKRFSFPYAQVQKANFEDADFKDASRFESLKVVHSISFEGANFRGKANFKRANFGDSSNFRKVVFHDGGTFENASFRIARFEDMHSMKKLVFKVANFADNAYFHRSKFEEEFVMRGCETRGNVYLNSIDCKKFDGTGIEAHNSISVMDSTFHDSANFSRSIFHHDVYIKNSVFENLVSFENVTFDSRADFSQSEFKTEIKLSSSNPNVLVLEREQIEGKIYSENHQEYNKAKKVYIVLKRCFEFWGNHDDADWAYYRFRQAERKSQKSDTPIATFKKFFNWLFFDIGCGYGTKPLNVTILGGLVILCFTMLFWGFGDQFVVSEMVGKSDQAISLSQAFYISAMTFTTLGTEGVAPMFDNWLKYFMVIEGFLGLFLMTVFVGTYTRKMVK